MKTTNIEEIKDLDLQSKIEKMLENNSKKSFKFCDYTDKDFVCVVFNMDAEDEKRSIKEMIEDKVTFFLKEDFTRRGKRIFKQIDDSKAEMEFCKNYKI